MAFRHCRQYICFAFGVLHKWITSSSEVVTSDSRETGLPQGASVHVFSLQYILREQCLSIVVFIGEWHVTRRRVQSRHWSYLLSQETNSPWESFMQHCDVLLGLWNIFWLIPGFFLYIMTQRHRLKKVSGHSSVCICVRRSWRQSRGELICIHKIM